MAASTAARLALEFDRQIADLLSVAGGGAGGPVAPRDVRERLLESVFLNAVTALEAFLEGLFFKAVTGAIRTGNVQPVIRFPSEETAWKLVTPPRDRYLGWLPFADTSARARIFLVDGLPFTLLDDRDHLRTRLTEALTLRNMIAHRSDYARQKFDDLVGGRYASAGEYLAAASGASRICEAFLADFARIANGLCAPDEATVVTILGDADALRTGAKVGEGTYDCLGCGTPFIVPAGATRNLSCATCDAPCPACGRTGKTANFRKA